MGSRGAFEFRCPGCGERIEVNDSMKAALIDSGCVVCGTPVTGSAFSEF